MTLINLKNNLIDNWTGRRRTWKETPWYSTTFAERLRSWMEFCRCQFYSFWRRNSYRSSHARTPGFSIWFTPTKCWTISAWCSLISSSPTGFDCWFFSQQPKCQSIRLILKICLKLNYHADCSYYITGSSTSWKINLCDVFKIFPIVDRWSWG